MNIVLGLFDTAPFAEARAKYKASNYPFVSLLEWEGGLSIIDIVNKAIRKCDKCYFVLDGIKTPLRPVDSVTCDELVHIFEHPWLLDKVTFVLAGKEVSEEWIERKYFMDGFGKRAGQVARPSFKPLT
jgi:hypothetical protein